jgi:hypothetical protein
MLQTWPARLMAAPSIEQTLLEIDPSLSPDLLAELAEMMSPAVLETCAQEAQARRRPPPPDIPGHGFSGTTRGTDTCRVLKPRARHQGPSGGHWSQ